MLCSVQISKYALFIQCSLYSYTELDSRGKYKLKRKNTIIKGEKIREEIDTERARERGRVFYS